MFVIGQGHLYKFEGQIASIGYCSFTKHIFLLFYFYVIPGEFKHIVEKNAFTGHRHV